MLGRPLLACVMGLSVLAAPSVGICQQGEPDATDPTPDRGETLDRLIDLVGGALVTPDRSRESILESLRRVRDPRLEPLFAQLAASADPRLRLHGVLGLAELEPERGLDMLLVRRIDDPIEQATLLGQALRDGVLTEAQLGEVARWLEADPTLRAIVLARAMRIGDPSAATELRGLTDSESLAASVYASLALAEVGDPTERLEAVLDRVLALEDEDATGVLRAILAYSREEKLTAGAIVTERVLASTNDDGRLRLEALWTGLMVDPANKAFTEQWLEMFEAADDDASRLRMALALPAIAEVGGPAVDARLFAQAGGWSNELLAPLGAAAALIGSGQGQAGAEVLASMGYVNAGAWALDWASRHDNADRTRLLRGTMDGARRLGDVRPTLYDLVARAATLAAQTDPSGVGESILLSAQAGDEAMTRALLVGALEAGENAALVRLPDLGSWPGEDSAALASLVRARAADLAANGLDGGAKDVWFDSLASIALGRAPVSKGVRVQAAWLAIRCASAERVALTRVLADVPR